jgi:hypothetical protein
MALSKTTKIQAINTMLSTVGEPPINSLAAQRADALIAQNILDEVCREVLTYGWHFNTDENVSLVPDSNTGFIYVPDSVVRVDMPRNEYEYDIVIRGNRLYNKKTNSYVFSGSISVIQVYLMDFEDMPESAKRYVTIRAARIFQDRMVGSEKHHAFTLRDEVAALATMTEYENEIGDYTIFDSPDVYRTFLRQGSYRVY